MPVDDDAEAAARRLDQKRQVEAQWRAADRAAVVPADSKGDAAGAASASTFAVFDWGADGTAVPTWLPKFEERLNTLVTLQASRPGKKISMSSLFKDFFPMHLAPAHLAEVLARVNRAFPGCHAPIDWGQWQEISDALERHATRDTAARFAALHAANAKKERTVADSVEQFLGELDRDLRDLHGVLEHGRFDRQASAASLARLLGRQTTEALGELSEVHMNPAALVPVLLAHAEYSDAWIGGGYDSQFGIPWRMEQSFAGKGALAAAYGHLALHGPGPMGEDGGLLFTLDDALSLLRLAAPRLKPDALVELGSRVALLHREQGSDALLNLLLDPARTKDWPGSAWGRLLGRYCIGSFSPDELRSRKAIAAAAVQTLEPQQGASCTTT